MINNDLRRIIMSAESLSLFVRYVKMEMSLKKKKT
jgi:hypothetical protein